MSFRFYSLANISLKTGSRLKVSFFDEVEAGSAPQGQSTLDQDHLRQGMGFQG